MGRTPNPRATPVVNFPNSLSLSVAQILARTTRWMPASPVGALNRIPAEYSFQTDLNKSARARFLSVILRYRYDDKGRITALSRSEFLGRQLRLRSGDRVGAVRVKQQPVRTVVVSTGSIVDVHSELSHCDRCQHCARVRTGENCSASVISIRSPGGS